MEKKLYEAPVVKKVSLEIKNAVLAVCYSSTVADPLDTCHINYCAMS